MKNWKTLCLCIAAFLCLTDVYYDGDQYQWNSIRIGTGNKIISEPATLIVR